MRARDQDIVFTGNQRASTPKNLISAGEVSRLLNARFTEGAISNGVGFEEFKPQFHVPGKRLFASNVTYQQLLNQGDVQLVAPLQTLSGKFQIMVISGILFSIDLRTGLAYDITPPDANLPLSSSTSQLSYLDNGGDVYGVGAYLVIFNYPNLPIFVSQYGARLSQPERGEMPVARLGASASNRVFIISGENILWASDPLGGAENLAPLTFRQTYDASTGFTGQIFSIGSALDVQHVTALCRLPKFLGPNQAFLGQNLLASSLRQKNIIAAGTPRDAWEGNTQFITYAGSSDGIAGPLACTPVGDNVVYVSISGQIKTIAQDQQRETGLSETYLDDPLGQYACCWESDFSHKPWYAHLDHTHAMLKYNRNRLFVSVFPVKHPGIGRFGKIQYSNCHRALAVASLASETLLGPNAAMTWEGFYDWLNPVGLITVGDTFYVVSKDQYGRNSYYYSDLRCSCPAPSIIYTRGYFNAPDARSRSVSCGYLYFRIMNGEFPINISMLIDGNWVCVSEGTTCGRVYKFTTSKQHDKTESASVPLKISLEHGGCRFELESVKLDGEYHYNT